jgi:hypothetical protein
MYSFNIEKDRRERYGSETLVDIYCEDVRRDTTLPELNERYVHSSPLANAGKLQSIFSRMFEVTQNSQNTERSERRAADPY